MFWLRNKNKIALEEAVRAAGKPATALIVEEAIPEGHVFPPTATHFGGNPYFELGDTWPTLGDDERPYDFLCQVNLNDCPHRPDVPFDLITVFFCWFTIEADDFERACIVRTYQTPSADKAVSILRPPAREAEDYRVRPCIVHMETFTTYPWSIERCPAIAAAASKFRDPRRAYAACLKRLGFWHCNASARVRQSASH